MISEYNRNWFRSYLWQYPYLLSIGNRCVETNLILYIVSLGWDASCLRYKLLESGVQEFERYIDNRVLIEIKKGICV
jgi:hypothetical protein